MPRVTVVPADRLVIVDGQALILDFNAPERMHALQWDGKQGHIEWLGSGDEPPHNEPLAADSYAGQVAPYVELWKEEKARLEQAAAEAEAARLAEYNSEAARFERLRAERADLYHAWADIEVAPSGGSPLGTARRICRLVKRI